MRRAPPAWPDGLRLMRPGDLVVPVFVAVLSAASFACAATERRSAMKARDAKKGIAALCIGGGEAVAMAVERV